MEKASSKGNGFHVVLVVADDFVQADVVGDGGDEVVGRALVLGPAGPPNAVDIVFPLFRNIIIDVSGLLFIAGRRCLFPYGEIIREGL